MFYLISVAFLNNSHILNYKYTRIELRLLCKANDYL